MGLPYATVGQVEKITKQIIHENKSSILSEEFFRVISSIDILSTDSDALTSVFFPEESPETTHSVIGTGFADMVDIKQNESDPNPIKTVQEAYWLKLETGAQSSSNSYSWCTTYKVEDLIKFLNKETDELPRYVGEITVETDAETGDTRNLVTIWPYQD